MEHRLSILTTVPKLKSRMEKVFLDHAWRGILKCLIQTGCMTVHGPCPKEPPPHVIIWKPCNDEGIIHKWIRFNLLIFTRNSNHSSNNDFTSEITMSHPNAVPQMYDYCYKLFLMFQSNEVEFFCYWKECVKVELTKQSSLLKVYFEEVAFCKLHSKARLTFNKLNQAHPY